MRMMRLGKARLYDFPVIDCGRLFVNRRRPSIATATVFLERIFLSRVKPPKAALRALDRQILSKFWLTVAIDSAQRPATNRANHPETVLRNLTGLAVVAALVLSTVPGRAQDMVPPCHSRSVNVEHASKAAKSDAAGSSLCAQGSQAAVHLEVRQTTIAAVLSALSTAYKISYRSSIALNETRDGIYSGSLGRVISRVLDGYNYVIKQQNSALDVVIFDKKGEQAVPAPIATEVSENSARRAARVSRTR